jgi:hypothetical protein
MVGELYKLLELPTYILIESLMHLCIEKLTYSLLC